MALLVWGLPSLSSGESAPSTTNVETRATMETESRSGWNWAPGEGITYRETPILATELSIAFDSKYIYYGLVENNDPIMTMDACFTAFGCLCVGIESIFDVSRYGIDAGYGNRKFKYTENLPYAMFIYRFSPEDFPWLPTTIGVECSYSYEAHPLSMYQGYCVDSQFVTFAVVLPDIWFEPSIYYERDIMRDNGTYLKAGIGHTFSIIDGEDEDDDPVLYVRPAILQGWGDERRISAYLPDIHRSSEEEWVGLEHQGLMDTCFRVDVGWNVCPGVALRGYVAYNDYLFDPSTREASRYYEATGRWDMSYNFVTGISLVVSF